MARFKKRHLLNVNWNNKDLDDAVEIRLYMMVVLLLEL
jgi:hypothetical protein